MKFDTKLFETSPSNEKSRFDYNNELVLRNLVKRYGIRIIYSIDGQAGKFDFASLTITLGAGLGFFGSNVFFEVP